MKRNKKLIKETEAETETEAKEFLLQKRLFRLKKKNQKQNSLQGKGSEIKIKQSLIREWNVKNHRSFENFKFQCLLYVFFLIFRLRNEIIYTSYHILKIVVEILLFKIYFFFCYLVL